MRKEIGIYLLKILIVVFFFTVSSYGDEEVVLKEIRVKGNKTISENVVLSKIKSRRGQPFSRYILNQDLKRIYSLGYFAQISIDVEETIDGVNVTFVVQEKPILKEIIFEGNKKFSEKKLRKKMEIKLGSVLSESQVKEDIEQIRAFYEEKGFQLADISYDIRVDESIGDALLIIRIIEKEKIKIERCEFIGVTAFKPKQIFKVMKTKKAGLLSSGILKKEEFDEDLERIVNYYRSEGFLDAQIINVEQQAGKKKNRITIRITIDEGRQYYVGIMIVQGNERFPTVDLTKKMKMKKGDVFTPKKLYGDISTLRDYYYEKGYIDVKVSYETVINPDTGDLDLVFSIKEGELSRIGKILIKGNVKTKDIVIRRELKVKPGEIFDGVNVKRSQERLLNLGFFKTVFFDIEPTNIPDERNLVIQVEEQKTGELGFGAGFSSIDKLIGFVEITQKNFDLFNFPRFTGDGQKLRFRTQFGKERRDFILSFTEPWFFNKPLSFGVDLYNRDRKYLSDVYDETKIGGKIKFGKRITDFIRADLGYTLEKVDITDVAEDASDLIKVEEGKNTVSKMSLTLTRDTRNNFFMPSRGMNNSVTAEYAGGILGEDRDFTKYYTTNSLYIPLWFETVVRFSVKAGTVDNFGDSDRVPIFERFFLGGANSIRGFKYRDVGPKDEFGEPIGGQSMFAASVEFTFPIIAKVRGAVFYDTGNCWVDPTGFDLGDLRAGAGVGLRVQLPIGPIQIDYGYPINRDEYTDDKARLHFNIGYAF